MTGCKMLTIEAREAEYLGDFSEYSLLYTINVVLGACCTHACMYVCMLMQKSFLGSTRYITDGILVWNSDLSMNAVGLYAT